MASSLHGSMSAPNPLDRPFLRATVRTCARILPPCASTSTAPLTMKYMASPGSPLRMMTVPAWTVRAVRMLTRSEIEAASRHAKLDLGQRLGDRPGDIAKDQHHRDNVDDAGTEVPAASGLQDLERSPARCREACLHPAHLTPTASWRLGVRSATQGSEFSRRSSRSAISARLESPREPFNWRSAGGYPPAPITERARPFFLHFAACAKSHSGRSALAACSGHRTNASASFG
jgi:hypothetical protein